MLYLVLAGLGFIATGGDGISFVAENGVLIDLVPVNDEDNWLHVILGVTGVLAGLASEAAAPRHRRARPSLERPRDLGRARSGGRALVP